MTICYCIFPYSSHVWTRKYRHSVFKCSLNTGVYGIFMETYTILYLPIFSPNMVKYWTKNDRIRDGFWQWKSKNIHKINFSFQQNIIIEPILSILWKLFFTTLKKNNAINIVSMLSCHRWNNDNKHLSVQLSFSTTYHW